MLTEEQHAIRSTGIGASEIAAACGVDDAWKTPYELYHLKRGTLDDDVSGQSIDFGNEFELPTLKLSAKMLGLSIEEYPVPTKRHPKHQWMLATIDARFSDGIITEAKTKTPFLKHQLGDEWTDDVPIVWVMQAQQQMAVFDEQHVRFAVCIDVPNIRHYVVERDEELIDGIIEHGSAFWSMVENGIEPEPTWNHRSTNDVIRRRFSGKFGALRNLSDEGRRAWEQRQRIEQHIKRMKAKSDQLKSRVMFEIGDSGGGVLSDGRVVRRSIVNRSAYSVEPKTYTTFREAKLSDTDRVTEFDIEQIDGFYRDAIAELQDMGAKTVDCSENDSWYYELPTGRRLRLSNHAPNKKTLKWMMSNDVISVRADLGERVQDAIQQQES